MIIILFALFALCSIGCIKLAELLAYEIIDNTNLRWNWETIYMVLSILFLGIFWGILFEILKKYLTYIEYI